MTAKRYSIGIAAIVLTAAIGLSGCTSDTLAVPGGDATATDGAGTQEQVIAEAPVADSVPSSPVLDEIKENGALKWGGNASRPLFGQLDPTTGTYKGFDAGLAYMFAKYVTGEPNIEYTGVTVVNREALLQNDTVQFVTDGYSITPERAELVNFAGPYLKSGVMIGIPTSDTTSTSVDDLKGKSVATLSGLAENSLLAAVPDAQPVVFSSASEAVQAVLQGHADAVAIDEPSLLGAIAKNKDDLKLLNPDAIADLWAGIGLPKDDPALKDFVNDWLVQISDSGLYAKLWEATIGDIAPTPTLPEIGSVPGS
jgi:glutamate transport system substrate-binding protein